MYVQPTRRNPRGLLGAVGVYCRGNWAVGGAVTWAADGSSATIIPDDAPGKPVTLQPLPGGSLASLFSTYRTRPRVAFSGFLLTNDVLLADGGAGSLSANEFYRTNQRGTECPAVVTALYPAEGAAPAGAPEPAEPPPPPPFTGTQVATVQVVGGGIPSNVTVYAEDGRVYKLAADSDPTNAQELATIAPQGPALQITGRWDPAAGTVRVTEWLIVATGEKKYGVEPETGAVVPQAPGIPSTDWPGAPATPEVSPGPYGGPEEAAPTTAGLPLNPWLLGFLGWIVVDLYRRSRK